MHYDAELRIRELTQNIYDIGDEIAEHIDNIGEAMQDWDLQLVADCCWELENIIEEGCAEVRPGLTELNGLRQAFISGIRAGSMSNPARTAQTAHTYQHPGRTLSFMHTYQPHNVNKAHTDTPVVDPRTQAMASTASWRIWMREQNATYIQQLNHTAEWVVEQTGRALERQSVLLQQTYRNALQTTLDIVEQWRDMVRHQPTLAHEMRGEAPPQFLENRARVDAVVNKLIREKISQSAG